MLLAVAGMLFVADPSVENFNGDTSDYFVEGLDAGNDEDEDGKQILSATTTPHMRAKEGGCCIASSPTAHLTQLVISPSSRAPPA